MVSMLGSDSDNTETGAPIGYKVTITHDETGTDATDAAGTVTW